MARLLAIASSGGHWQQLMLMRAAWDEQDAIYFTTMAGLAEDSGASPSRVVPDCNAKTPLRALGAALFILIQLLRIRPAVVITTGALPGLLAIALGRVTGARTIWIDSVANAERLSASGRVARRIAHLTLSQWRHVAEAEGVEYAGSVL